jgi:hypothetical protein
MAFDLAGLRVFVAHPQTEVVDSDKSLRRNISFPQCVNLLDDPALWVRKTRSLTAIKLLARTSAVEHLQVLALNNWAEQHDRLMPGYRWPVWDTQDRQWLLRLSA